MGRQAKLRQQRKQTERSPASADAPTPTSSKATLPKPPSAIGQFLKRLNPFSKETEDLSWLEEERDRFEENNRLASAIAKTGYSKQKRGVVFAIESPDSAPNLEYLPRRAIDKTLRQHGVEREERKDIAQLVESYDPQHSFVLIYCDRNGAIEASVCSLSLE